MPAKRFKTKQFIFIVLLTSIWINASEVFRYFVFVMPLIKDYWTNAGREVAEMNAVIFSIWGLWDMLLTVVLVFAVWLYGQVFDYSFRSVVFSATIVWATVFVIFWVAASNMGLSNWSILWLVLPLSWLEMVIGGWISSRLLIARRWA